jgi:putative Mg2+ transporter-C (MgtC) family protein
MILDFYNQEFFNMSFRILFALILSGCIGWERESWNQPAGLRTHILVGVGSCLMMLLSLYGFQDYLSRSEHATIDYARIPSYVISGIGFLGAGVILNKGMTVHGLTTAASIWVVAGIGLIVGVGMYELAILTTIIVLFSLYVLKRVLHKKSSERG